MDALTSDLCFLKLSSFPYLFLVKLNNSIINNALVLWFHKFHGFRFCGFVRKFSQYFTNIPLCWVIFNDQNCNRFEFCTEEIIMHVFRCMDGVTSWYCKLYARKSAPHVNLAKVNLKINLLSIELVRSHFFLLQIN